ncbi:uncharacterized protein LOC117580460 [Drosophila guanche]|uniref:Uncharacterized protein n=1 Tax=Drosophila guanche TaxID=7266 RepID=A0A3B0J587_DROGU|nr:uncharacterized protein LOC117580460 [Drosophila guanche]SPP74782.1 Hypothetical predicted protein [Drosophila guanche]
MLFIELILVCSLAAAALLDADKRLKRRKSLSWWQEQYYHSKWRQRFRFTTTAVPGATPEWREVRMVYPCYCYKPPQKGEATTEAYERYMVEREDLFILNK